MITFAVIFPFVLLLLLTLVFRRPLWQGGLVALTAAVVCWCFAPGVTLLQLAPPLVKAFVVATEVGLILLGAIAFLEYMTRIGTTDRLQNNRPVAENGIGFALWAGFCYSIPAYGLVWLGPEFPSLAGSLVGIGLFSATLLWRRKGTWATDSPRPRFRDLARAFAPYLLLCLFLLAGKALLGGTRFHFELGGSQENIGFFQPGLLFLLTIVLLAVARKKESPADLARLVAYPGKRLPGVWLAIFCMASLAQFAVRLSNPANALGPVFDGPHGAPLLILVAPLAGTLGSFMAGSATVSNLLCAPFLIPACALTGADPGLVLGLQLIGAGAGNMISLQNLVAVQATVGLQNREAEMLKLLWKPCLAYLTAASVAGWIISQIP